MVSISKKKTETFLRATPLIPQFRRYPGFQREIVSATLEILQISGEGPPMRPNFGPWKRGFFLTAWLRLRVALDLRVAPQFGLRVVL